MFKSVFVVFIATIAFANCYQGLDLSTAIGNSLDRAVGTAANVLDKKTDFLAKSINTFENVKHGGLLSALQGTSKVLGATGKAIGTVIEEKGNVIRTIGDAVKNFSGTVSETAVESLGGSGTRTTGYPYAFQGFYPYPPQGADPYRSQRAYSYSPQGGYPYPPPGGYPYPSPGGYPYPPPGGYPYPPPGGYPYPPQQGYPYQYPSQGGYSHPPQQGYPYQYQSQGGYPYQYPPQQGSPLAGEDSNVNVEQTHINSVKGVRVSTQRSPTEPVHVELVR